MDDRDPFNSSSDRTIMKPSPGQRKTQFSQPAPDAFVGIGEIEGTGANPVLSAATSLLALAGQLRRATAYDDVSGLFRNLSSAIRKFNQDLTSQGASPETLSVSRYVICGFLDEAILNTPWGGESNWASHTLLAEFHNELYAGEKVFQLVDVLKREPGKNLDLLELIYVCISLGFQGRYRRLPDGLNQLENVRADLYAIIRGLRPQDHHDLSINWRGVKDKRPGLVRYVPWWVVSSVALALLCVAYFVFLMLLSNQSDPLARQIAMLGTDLPVLEEPPPPPPREAPTLVKELSSEIASRPQLEARQDPNLVIVRSMFDVGSASVTAANLGVIKQVADALQRLDGRVMVTGHTDNTPIRRSLRFPSNWELSKVRAQSVRDLLIQFGVSAERVSAAARADTEPYCATCNQDDLQERAKNRRVEIRLIPGASRE